MLTKKQQDFLNKLSVSELCTLVAELFYADISSAWIKDVIGLSAIEVADELAKRVRETSI
jgi:hypothetical protein